MHSWGAYSVFMSYNGAHIKEMKMMEWKSNGHEEETEKSGVENRKV